MIDTKEKLNEWISVERALWIKRNYPKGAPKHIRSKELLFVSALRHVEYYSTQTGIRKLGGYYWKVIYKLLSNVCNVMIPPNVFGKGLLIAHLQNIVISANCSVGEYCCIFHSTTMGISVGSDDHGECPKIGNGCTICTGAGIFGNVWIADGVTVAANAVVVKTVTESNAVVGGIPARVISKDAGWSMLNFKNTLEK